MDKTVNLSVVNLVRTAPGHSQKKEISPGWPVYHMKKDYKLKSVKGASCVTQLCCVNPVTNVKLAATNLPVGARLQNFWQTWLDLGAGPKVVQILREGYTLPFRTRPNLTRSPTVISCYVNPHRNSYLLEALHQLMDKNAVELVHNQRSLGFFNRLFLVPKPNKKWRPILDLSKLNIFLKTETFKMETPETIRTSLQQGEWVTSIDFKDAYFHIPIQEQSRKYLRFHVQGQTYQFKALPFGLSTAPLEFTVVAKEVKLMATREGIRLHQYLDDWLVRASSHRDCLQHTQVLVKMCQKLGWLVNLEKSELEPKQVFDFVGYQFDLLSGRVRPTPERWQNLQDKILEMLAKLTCPVRQFMSLIGLLTATEKQVHERTAYKLPGTQSSVLSLKRVPRPLHRQNSSCSNRQYHCGGLHKQRRRNAIGSPLCSPLENTNLVYQTKGNPQSPTYPRPSKCDSRQAIQAWSDHPDGVVSPSRGLSRDMQKVAPTSSGFVCHKVQQQVAPICVTSTGPPGYSSGRTQSAMGGSGRICLPTNSHSGQSGGEVAEHPMQKDHFDRPGVAEHVLVLGSGNHVHSNPSESTLSAKPPVTAIQSDPSPKSDKPESPCMASRAKAIKKQGFSKAVAERIEAPQRVSTRSVYEAKWTIFTKWCVSNQVDFRAPPINSVADFLLYLFQDRKLQPSTIDGYRSAIADKLGNSPTNISKDENLTRLLDSFHRDRPKGRRGIPSWNLSLVLHQLTKAPFEPIKEASMKHLTFKTVFLLALGSGKRRSEIHAWLHRNIRHQSDWSKVSLYPSPSFLSKNQLAKEGPESVAPVVIPALAPTLDKSLRSDRSLCPVRALRYYLDRTSDLRQNKELVFVSFKKGFNKDISPATISSWIKQTVILCYELSDHQAHTLHQVKAHDVRAFAASKAFQSGVSLEQILSACHWKSHNTFTQFYLKDVAWADAELYHLGPVVAAQQIHQRTSAKGRSVHM